MKIISRIIIWTVFIPTSYFAYQNTNNWAMQYAQDTIEIPRNEIICVDQKSTSDLQNGSPEHPFKTISNALEFQKTNTSFRKILISPGEYVETIILPKNISLLGFQGRPKIKNPIANKGKTITCGNNNFLANLEVAQGKYGIFIPPNDSVTLFEVSIFNSSKWGIYTEKSSNIDSGKLAMISSQVYHSAHQGLYLQKGTFYMNNSKSFENGEEGIDLHIDMKSKIKNSEILENGEGGIETEIGNIDLSVKNTQIKNNESSGINLQSFQRNSVITIENNIIENNKNFGIRCAIHSKIRYPYFSETLKLKGDNGILKNRKQSIDPNCSN